MNLFSLDIKEQIEMKKYFSSCPKRKLTKNYINAYNQEILPNIKQCHLMENFSYSGMNRFCDSMISHYFEYIYDNETNNIISRCSNENIKNFMIFVLNIMIHLEDLMNIMHICFISYFKIFSKICIILLNKLKIIMIGGNDTTVNQIMNCLDELKIIPRTHYLHDADNIFI